MNEARLNDGKLHWGALELGASEDDALPLRAWMARELLETRILIYALYRERSDGDRGLRSSKSFRRTGIALPWFQITPYDDVPFESTSEGRIR